MHCALNRKVAVVTGAGSGIGQALAIELARSGAKLAISDVDTEGLAATRSAWRQSARRSRRIGSTSPREKAFLAYADVVNAHFGVVNQIYNKRASHSPVMSRRASSRTSNK